MLPLLDDISFLVLADVGADVDPVRFFEFALFIDFMSWLNLFVRSARLGWSSFNSSLSESTSSMIGPDIDICGVLGETSC